MDSILNSIKKLLGIADDYACFDTDIMLHINSAFSVLTQIGVGPETGFTIEDANATWNDFIPDDPRLGMVKTYVFLKVKSAFDPPTSSGVLTSYDQMAKEYEWRLQVATDPPVVPELGGENQNGV